ncbi:hypothetical protein GBAR_LOCUS8230, partial [Geodia barretti]
SCCLFASESFQVLIRPLCFVQILPVSRYDFRYRNIRRIYGVSRSGREMRVSVLLVLVVGLGACCLAEGEGKVEFQVQDETCSDYCAATYPKHTYPEPDDHCACTRGCRMAVMDALMSWPFAPDRSFCLSTCKEAYGSDGHLYACQTGCNVTTIDQKVPNRDQIYQTTGGTKEFGLVMELFEAISSQLPNGDGQMEMLTQQAESMYQLLPGGGKVSAFVIIEENEGSVEIEYGESIVDGLGYAERLEDLQNRRRRKRRRGEMGRPHTACLVLGSTPREGGLLSLVGVGLILVAIVTCCCSGLLSDEVETTNQETGTKKRESQLMAVEVRKEKMMMMSPQLQSPPTFSLGYPQPLPVYSEKKSTQL